MIHDPTAMIELDFAGGRLGFGAPESVLNASTFYGMMQAWQNGPYYECPISLEGMARVHKAMAHHASALDLKCNLIASSLIPNKKLSRLCFLKLVKDYLCFGNAYVQRIDNVKDKLLRLEHLMAKYTRVGVKPGTFYWVPRWATTVPFEDGDVFHFVEPDIDQEIYGMPQWLPALQSILLNENATLFRRRYYINGAHTGFILYVTATFGEEEAEAIKKQLKESKGVGNFRNLALFAPGSPKEGIQIVPISEVAAKDEFLNVKNITRDDVLAAHRVPPQLLGIVPQHAGGFGDISSARNVFFQNEIMPLQNRMLELNDWLGDEVVQFAPFVPAVLVKDSSVG